MHPKARDSTQEQRHLNLYRALIPATLFLCAALISACGSGGDKDITKKSEEKPKVEKVQLAAGDVKVVSTGNTGEANLTDVDALVGATAKYVRQASVIPMHGEPLNISDLLTSAARPNAVGEASDALTDVGVSPATDSIEVISAPLPITILTDNTGAGALASVSIDITISTKTKTGAVEIHRVGELAFVYEGGVWLIDGWRLTVNRDGKGIASAPRTSSSTKAP
ncbi:MAG: hypothetical protein JHD40_05845 [Acidimicrobiia bacterium]|nr:hypothetical protein [Acidimicrobiia bacterium]